MKESGALRQQWGCGRRRKHTGLSTKSIGSAGRAILSTLRRALAGPRWLIDQSLVRDQGLSQGHPTVIRRHEVVREYLETLLRQASDAVLKKAKILKRSAAQTDSAEAGGLADPHAGGNRHFSHRSVKARRDNRNGRVADEVRGQRSDRVPQVDLKQSAWSRNVAAKFKRISTQIMRGDGLQLNRGLAFVSGLVPNTENRCDGIEQASAR